MEKEQNVKHLNINLINEEKTEGKTEEKTEEKEKEKGDEQTEDKEDEQKKAECNNINLSEYIEEKTTSDIEYDSFSTVPIQKDTDGQELQKKTDTNETYGEVKEIDENKKEEKEKEEKEKEEKEKEETENEVENTQKEENGKEVKANGVSEENCQNTVPINEKPTNEQISPKFLRKGSMDFDLMNDSIFNITISLDEDKIKKDKETAFSKEKGKGKKEKNGLSENQQKSKDFKKILKEKDANANNDTNTDDDSNSSNDSSCNSSGEVSKILKINMNNKIEKKNRSSYILQHKQRIKQTIKEKTHMKKKPNESQVSYIKINKNSRESVKRANAATLMLEKFKHLNSDDENSDYSDGYSSSEFLENVNVFQ